MNNPLSDSAQAARAAIMRALHQRPGIFVIPNPWDAGSARLLSGLGFEALATTSAGLAFSLGRPDGEAAITREEALANARAIVSATDLPVSADLENGYGEDPAICAETVRLAAGVGLVGCSIEDRTGRREDPILPFDLSVERVRAAVQAARSLPFPFTLTARSENLICGRPDMPDTLRRLKAYAEAGADVLFAPGLETREQIDAVVRAVAPKPVSVVMGLSKETLTIKDLEDLGVKRISVGAALSRVAYSAVMRAAEEIQAKGVFTFARDIVPYAEFNRLFRDKTTQKP